MKTTNAAKIPNLLPALCLLLWTIPAFAGNVQSNLRVIHEIKHDVSLPLRDMARTALPVRHASEALEPRRPKYFVGNTHRFDPVVQDVYLPKVPTTNLLNFDAMTSADSGSVDPPDTNGSVGSTQFVEIVNFAYAVYDKSTGGVVLAATPITTIWSGFGGFCETNAGGDPVVLWDKAAQRWLVTELSFNDQFSDSYTCVAVSTSADATGSYNRYAFDQGSIIPDYPKYAVWPDAYYSTFNAYALPSQNFLGAEPCALDRSSMLGGGNANMICFNPDPNNFGFLPSDLDGANAPPRGAPNHYVDLGNTTDRLNEFDFHVDFVNPKKSTFKGPHPIPVPTYALICNDGGNFACVPQPSPGEMVDSLSGLLTFRLAYRNFGGHESMVVAHAVQPGKGSTATVATRWYELRSTPAGRKFKLYQAGTFQNKTINLWMASIAMDKQGDIVMGMSADSSTTLKPSVWYTGRIPSDPLGKMEAPSVAVKGTAVQVNGNNRWGDYSSMSIDSDDCTFWYAQEYYNQKNGGSSSNDWTSRLVSFKFDNCK